LRNGTGAMMMPISVLSVGEESVIKRIGGSPEVRQHLEDLGFVVGVKVSIVSKLADNFIVNVKGSRIAIDGSLAKDIFV
jgi:ferrous iron transport protein A